MGVAGLEVVLITPQRTKNPRSCDGAAGDKHDRFDAFGHADTLRTDPGLLHP